MSNQKYNNFYIKVGTVGTIFCSKFHTGGTSFLFQLFYIIVFWPFSFLFFFWLVQFGVGAIEI
jgi:hypothetical protein